MEILSQLGLIFFFGLAGHALAGVLPLSAPASVLGLLLLLLALKAGLIRPEALGKTADYLSDNMAFFFLPSAVAVMGEYGRIRAVLGPLLLILTATTLLTFGAVYGVTRAVQRLTAGGEEP